MEVWIVEEGEKRGPYQAYEIRDRIERKELAGNELAWHRDREGWIELREMDAFRAEFDKSPQELARSHPPPLPPQPYPFLRFFARWFDVCLYLLFIFGLVQLVGLNLYNAMGGSFRALYFLPFVCVEAAFIHLTKTTPGKFLLGIRVVTPEESALSLQASLVRSLRAYIVGLGLMFAPLLTVMCHTFCIWYLMRFSEAPWDTTAKTRIRVTGPLLFPVILFIMFFVIIVALLSLVLMPAVFQAWEELSGQMTGLG